MDSKNPNGANTRAEVYDWIQCIIFALVFCVLLFVFGARMVNVVGHSMVPTLEQNDKVIISNLLYHPKQGDIVVLRKQTLMDEPIVKRIIATEGQTVDIDFDDGVVYVDGKALDEPYVNAPVHDRENFEGKITVPKGSVFVMGDNRANSADSRYHQDDGDRGFVPISDVVGVGIAKYWPLDRLGAIDDHHEVFKDVPDASGSNS